MEKEPVSPPGYTIPLPRGIHDAKRERRMFKKALVSAQQRARKQLLPFCSRCFRDDYIENKGQTNPNMSTYMEPIGVIREYECIRQNEAIKKAMPKFKSGEILELPPKHKNALCIDKAELPDDYFDEYKEKQKEIREKAAKK